MDVGKAIYNILINTPNVLSVLSESGSNPRIFPSRYKFPVTVLLPYVTYQVVSDIPNNTKNGVSTYDYVDVQISLYCTTYVDISRISERLRTALDYNSGTFNGVEVDKIFFQNESEIFDDSAGEQGFYGLRQDYRFNINR